MALANIIFVAEKEVFLINAESRNAISFCITRHLFIAILV